MIPKAEILAHAKNTNLSASIIEKDYVLGWILAGIFNHNVLKDRWIFKGGTCLKKCYFETYRFSEDLDFTLRDEAHINLDFLYSTFNEIAAWIYEQSGIEIPSEKIEFEIYTNKLSKLSCQGKLSYSGPLAPKTTMRQWPRIKLDLTAYERLLKHLH
jgi:predicted nucleotidyltransferase component of viral defense system